MFSLRFIVTLSNFDSFWPHRPTWLRIKAWVYRKSFTNRLWWHRVRCWPACRMYWDLHPLLGDTITSLISGTLPEYFRYRNEVINRDWTILLSLLADGKNGSKLDTSSLWPVDWGCVLTIPHSFSWRYQKLSGIVWTPIRYVTLHSSDRRGVASLRYRNRAQITVLMCKQKPYLVWFPCQHKSYLVYCKLTTARVLSLYVSTATQYQMPCHLHATGCF